MARENRAAQRNRRARPSREFLRLSRSFGRRQRSKTLSSAWCSWQRSTAGLAEVDNGKGIDHGEVKRRLLR